MIYEIADFRNLATENERAKHGLMFGGNEHGRSSRWRNVSGHRDRDRTRTLAVAINLKSERHEGVYDSGAFK